MAELTFSQSERRSFLIPISIAIVALALIIWIAVRFYPATAIHIDHVHTDIVKTHTVFKSDSIVIGSQPSQDVLYVVETLKIDNQLRIAISLDDFSLTLTNPDGKQLSVKAVQKNDLSNLGVSFPQLKPLLSAPLLRDTNIDPGKVAQGAVVFALPVPKAMWDARQSGVVRVDLYHQPSLFLTIPTSKP